MRRSLLASIPNRLAYATSVAVASFAALSLCGCEDGPTQTYSPAPGGAGSNWNGGSGPSWVDNGQKDYSQKQTGQNKQQLCTGAEKAKMWGWALTQDIVPPSGGGGLDLSGGASWQGLTVEQAETPVRDSHGALVIPPPTGGGLCQGDAQGDLFGDGAQVISWGDNAELWMHYVVSNRKGNFLVFYSGYLGKMKLTSRMGGRFGDNHNYIVPVNTQVMKDGMGFNLDWHGPKSPTDWRNELHDAMLATFAPGLPPSDDCNADGRCIGGQFGDVAYFYVPAIGSAIWVANQNAGQPTASIPNRIDGDLAKVTPFAFASPLLKLDAEGPTASAGRLGSAAADCVLKFGQTYGDFLKNCVQVSGNTTKDTVELNKLLGGLRHGTERFHFDITGVDVNFTDATLAADKVVGDTDKPSPGDTSTEFRVDQATLGKFSNDFVNNDGVSAGATQDFHGAGMVYLEYANLVQQQLNGLIGGSRQLGDPACTGIGKTVAQIRAAGCTGFEGVVTAAPAALSSGYTTNGVGLAAKGFGIGGMKPGHHTIAFCNDANGDTTTGYKDCSDKGDTFPASFARVLKVLGNGVISNLPVEARDNRFYFKQWFTALIKYLKVATNPSATLAMVDAVQLDSKNLFFDSLGAGQFEIGEYVDRSAVTATSDPVDIVFTADVKNGIMNSYDFSRDILRGETAMYTSMIDHRIADDPPGKQDTALLTNMFGSPVLKAAYKDHTIKGTGGNPDKVTPAYYCATNIDTTPGVCCDVDSTTGGCVPGSLQLPPVVNNACISNPNTCQIVQEDGGPVLAPYEGAFGSNKTVWALGTAPVSIVQTYDAIQSAMITVPLHKNPYDLASPAPVQGASMNVLVPWTPKQPGIGFPVALTGTRDKFVETYQLGMSGNTITANVDYDFTVDTSTHLPTKVVNFLAVETTDFLGDVFLCQDPITKDLLRARMYTSVSTILDWFSSHPGAYQACQMIVRYSPYGNYADYVTSGIGGVRLGITQGGGYGRVVDGTLYDPKVATSQ
jgi:hypothetical protein